MNRRRLPIGALTLGMLLALAVAPNSLTARLQEEVGEDEYDDLAIGVPWDMVGPYRPGQVAVFYGSSYPGLSGVNALWDQDASGTWNGAEDADEFGKVLAAGDFDGDGYYDLAIGVPQEDLWSLGSAGAVTVLYGSALGITSRSQLWYQNILTDAATGDRYGSALAAGDFNGDGYDDLAVGVPEEDLPDKADAGEVEVINGTASGLGLGHQEWDQDNLDVNWGASAGDKFGSALAAGDFNNDGYDDLAVGVPFEDSYVAIDIGVVNIVYGSATGLNRSGKQQWHQDDLSSSDGADTGDQFGSSLVTGDFNGDSYADLVVGVPNENIGTVANAGAANVIYGSALGLRETGNQFWKQPIGNSDAAEEGDRFGWALAAGNFDGDRYADVAMGVPYEDVGATVNAGAVDVVYGSVAGLYNKHGWWFNQDLLDLTETAEGGDTFGWALAAGDFDGNGCDDLAVGVPHEDIGPYPDNNGLVNVVYGTVGGLGLGGPPDQYWWQGTTGVDGVASVYDRFGYSLIAIPAREHRIYLPLVQRDSS